MHKVSTHRYDFVVRQCGVFMIPSPTSPSLIAQHLFYLDVRLYKMQMRTESIKSARLCQTQVKTITIPTASKFHLTVALPLCATIMLSHSLFEERALALTLLTICFPLTINSH